MLVDADFVGFEVCDRTTMVDYEEMRKTCTAMFGLKYAIGLAIKLNLRGMKIKPDDYFKIGGVTVKVSDLMMKIHDQEGYGSAAAINKTLGKASKKTLVSLSRVARSFAAETSHAIGKNFVTVEKELAELAQAAGLEIRYAFLAAPWGCDDKTLIKHMDAMHKFAQGFDALIAKAHDKGWCEGNNPRSHAETFINYLRFRGIDQA